MQAKQQLSEVVPLPAQASHEPTLTEQFDEVRLALREARVQELKIPERSTAQRPNAFLQVLEEEGLIDPRHTGRRWKPVPIECINTFIKELA